MADSDMGLAWRKNYSRGKSMFPPYTVKEVSGIPGQGEFG
jgi:hypothetical protein